jgi:hypothetical protein
MCPLDSLPFIRQFDTVEQTVEVVVELRDGGEAMVQLEALRSSTGSYSISAYSLKEVPVASRTSADMTRSRVTYGMPLIEKAAAEAVMR